jgi:hypothetical protein
MWGLSGIASTSARSGTFRSQQPERCRWLRTRAKACTEVSRSRAGAKRRPPSPSRSQGASRSGPHVHRRADVATPRSWGAFLSVN